MASQLWHIRNCSLFQQLRADQLERLEQVARVRTFPKNSAVYLPHDAADSVMLLAAGRIRICSITPDGKQAILAFVEPGELFGELALVQTVEREERAEAAIDSTVVLLPGDAVRQLMETSAELTLGVTKLIGLRLTRVERRLRSLLFRSNRDRLGHLLLDLSQQYGSTTTEGTLLGIKLSHQELAAIVGATRETVTTLLGEMQAVGILNVSRQRIVLCDVTRLVEETGYSLPTVAKKRTP